MRPALLALALLTAGCASAPPEPPRPVRVELALTDEGYQPPVFRWDAPVAARVTVTRGSTVLWDVAEGDETAPDGHVFRGPITPPLVYGDAFDETVGRPPRVLEGPRTLRPGGPYTVVVIGYDGARFEGRFSVQAPFEFE